MPDVADWRGKVELVCEANDAAGRNAPRNKTELAEWLGLGSGTLSSGRYKAPTVPLTIAGERAIVMALGFGPTDEELSADSDRAWTRWVRERGPLWRDGTARELVAKFDEPGWFLPRPRDDPWLLEWAEKFRRPRRLETRPAQSLVPQAPQPVPAPPPEGRYLDRLGSFDVYCQTINNSRRLRAECSFGRVDISTEDNTYYVAINRCRAELFLQDCVFEPSLEGGLIESRSRPARNLKMKREASRRNHPTWLLEDSRRSTPLGGEYHEIDLGELVSGQIKIGDEANLLINKAGFWVRSKEGPLVEELGTLASIIRYLITEHVGEIEQRGESLFRLSIGEVRCEDTDDTSIND